METNDNKRQFLTFTLLFMDLQMSSIHSVYKGEYKWSQKSYATYAQILTNVSI